MAAEQMGMGRNWKLQRLMDSVKAHKSDKGIRELCRRSMAGCLLFEHSQRGVEAKLSLDDGKLFGRASRAERKEVEPGLGSRVLSSIGLRSSGAHGGSGARYGFKKGLLRRWPCSASCMRASRSLASSRG